MSDDFTGIIEAENITTRLEALYSGRVYESVDDGDSLSRDTDGKILPFIVVDFGDAFASSHDRLLNANEQAQPFIFPFTVLVIATTKNEARLGNAAVKRKLIGWSPSVTGNADVIRSPGGYNYTRTNTESKPTTYVVASYMRFTTNLAADPFLTIS